MADTVTTQVLHNGNRRYVVHLTNSSDGTGESAVTKVDVSTLTQGNIRGDQTATKLTVDLIEYDVQGFDSVTLAFDADTDDTIAQLSGQGVIDWIATGGLTDPQSTGATGDLKLTTNGAASGDTYSITLWLRQKA